MAKIQMKNIFIILLFTIIGFAAQAVETMTCGRNSSAFNCMVCNCYHETRGQPKEEKIAVAKTVLSRANSDLFPSDTACGIVYQPSQFSWTGDDEPNDISAVKSLDIDALHVCREAVDIAINEGPNGLLYFYNPRKVTPRWLRQTQSCGYAAKCPPNRPKNHPECDNHVFLVQRGQTCPKKLGSTGHSNSSQKKSSAEGSAR